MKFCPTLLALVAILPFVSCSSGSSGGTPPPPTTYTIGGMVSGLAGTGLVLQDNGGNNLSVASNSNFTFTAALNSGSAYNVTVLTQPSDPIQTCNVTNASGTATANVTNVQVSCTTAGYTIGGSVSGLAGAGLVLQNNGGDNLSIISNGSFTFETPIAPGATYAVTVLTQPSNPAQTCTVTNSGGTAKANVTDVQAVCSNNVPAAWAWENGSNAIDPTGSYGTLGKAAPGNDPGGRDSAINWIDTAGNFWLFGGNGHDSTGTIGSLNDLWTYSAGEWTWSAGSDLANQAGVYGMQGTADPGNIPGARDSSTSWTDAAGDLWVFGGHGYDSTGTEGLLNDLWKFSAGQWTWVAGSNLVGQAGTYGALGNAAPGNIPGARNSAAAWIDSAGNLWMFGGHGVDSAGTTGLLNDLWMYSAGEWTWIGGANVFGSAGTYGTEGMPAASNIPGARNNAAVWIDQAGDFWLFGGRGLDSTGSGFELNDLWKYSSGEWTWIDGSNIANQSGTYGTLGIASASNVPGARNGAAVWSDAAGNFWLSGGVGFDSAGAGGELNDLWTYSAGEWIWIGGPDIANQLGIYGTEGTFNVGDIPGSRNGAAVWTDAAGNVWLFGGFGHDATHASSGELNDLWEYQP